MSYEERDQDSVVEAALSAGVWRGLHPGDWRWLPIGWILLTCTFFASAGILATQSEIWGTAEARACGVRVPDVWIDSGTATALGLGFGAMAVAVIPGFIGLLSRSWIWVFTCPMLVFLLIIPGMSLGDWLSNRFYADNAPRPCPGRIAGFPGGPIVGPEIGLMLFLPFFVGCVAFCAVLRSKVPGNEEYFRESSSRRGF